MAAAAEEEPPARRRPSLTLKVDKELKRTMTDLAAGEQTDADAPDCTSPKYASTGLKGANLDYEGDGFTDVKASDVVSTAFVAESSPPMAKPGLAPGFVGGEGEIRPASMNAKKK